MTPRRKKWLRTIGLVAAILVVVGSLVKLTFLNASDAYQEDAARLRKELKKLNLFNSREGRYQTTLDDCAAQTLGLDVLEVREQLRKRIGTGHRLQYRHHYYGDSGVARRQRQRQTIGHGSPYF